MSELQPLSTCERSVTAYEDVVDRSRWNRLHALAAGLDGARILHVNSTAKGGGVAELLKSLVPLSNALDVDSDWLVMDGDESFFEVTKSIHNGLQGRGGTLSEEMKTTYRSVTERNAASVTEEYDVIVLHDPQSLGMIERLVARFPDTQFVWRCHIDLTSPTRDYMALLEEYVHLVDRIVVSHEEYGAAFDQSVTVVHPSIDPLADKNRDLGRSTLHSVREKLDDVPFEDAPVITQVSRFDPWKDPLGVVEAHRRLQERIPDVHLVLAGGMADDDPEGREVYERVEAAVADDPQVHLLIDRPDTVINALQRWSDVVWQKSLQEGFGLVVSEALWKRSPVVGSNVGGIPLQIDDGENGYLVDPEDSATLVDVTERLLTDDVLRERLGNRGRETVRDRFLLPRHLLDYLELYTDLL